MQSLQVSRIELSPPDGQDFWTQFQRPGAAPVFSTKEVASVFYGRSKLWMLRHLQNDDHWLDGGLIAIPRGTNNGAYRFQLAHVERTSHAFFQRAIIDIKQFENSLMIVKSIASNYRLI